MPSTSNDNLPAFRPINSGTATSRIVFVTRFAAVALPNVASNPNRTELRHDGTRVVATGPSETGTGSPMYGTYNVNYVTFDGIFVDMAQAQTRSDAGVFRVENGRGVHFRNFEIKGTRTNMGTNPVIYRATAATDTVLSNFRVYDFSNDTSNSNTPQQGYFSAQYGDQNFLMEHFEIRNTERGIFLKGTSPAGQGFNYGTIRYGTVSGVSSCYQFNDLHATNMTTLEYVLCHDVTIGTGLKLSAETTAIRNLLVHHLTIARVNGIDGNTIGCTYSRANGFGANVTIRDNVCDIDTGPHAHGVDFSEIQSLPSFLNYNGYIKQGGTLTFAYNGVQYNSLSAWRSATNRDLNSLALTSNPFVDRASGNFRIAPGHPAMTASSTGGQLGAYATAIAPGVDLGSIQYTIPSAPTNVRVIR